MPAVYQTTGAGGKIVRETLLDFPGGYEDVLGFWIQDSTILYRAFAATTTQAAADFREPGNLI